jgi:hypothetical protein
VQPEVVARESAQVGHGRSLLEHPPEHMQYSGIHSSRLEPATAITTAWRRPRGRRAG